VEKHGKLFNIASPQRPPGRKMRHAQEAYFTLQDIGYARQWFRGVLGEFLGGFKWMYLVQFSERLIRACLERFQRLRVRNE
jgi:hypothetical protein